MPEVYLVHHGILGQKWGVRRYQNSDGTLTAAGRRRRAADQISKIKAKTKAEAKDIRIKAKYQAKVEKEKAKADAKLAKVQAKADAKIQKAKGDKPKVQKEETTSKKKKSISEMSNDELTALVARMNLENQYKNALPKEPAQKERYITKLFRDGVGKAITNGVAEGGKKLLTNYINQKGSELLGIKVINEKEDKDKNKGQSK